MYLYVWMKEGIVLYNERDKPRVKFSGDVDASSTDFILNACHVHR